MAKMDPDEREEFLLSDAELEDRRVRKAFGSVIKSGALR